MARIRSRLTYANVMATIAVFVALGGSSYAALTVTGKNIKNGSVTGADIQDNSLRSLDVQDGGLLAKDFKAGQLPAGATGATGAQGPAGPAGSQGPPGPSLMSKVEVRHSFMEVGTAEAVCNDGERATGGGGLSGDGVIWESVPLGPENAPDGWRASAVTDTGPAAVYAYVVCLST